MARKLSKIRVNRSEELAVAALDLFAEKNYASVTIKDIANVAGINAALIYYYYKSKEDLFCAAIGFAVNQAFEKFRGLQTRHENPASIIDNWLNNHVQLHAPIYKFIKVSLDYSSSETKTALIDSQICAFYDEEKRILSDCISRGIKEGLFADVNAGSLALFISTHLDGIMVRSVILRDFNLNHAVEELRHKIWLELKYRIKGSDG